MIQAKRNGPSSMWIIADHERNHVTGSSISWRKRSRPKIRDSTSHTKTREQLLFVSDKRTDISVERFFPFRICSVRFTVRSCSPLTFILGELSRSATRIQQPPARVQSLWTTRAARSCCSTLSPLSAHKARFRAKADKSFRDGQETGLPWTRFKPGFTKVVRACYFSLLFLPSRC